MFSPNKDTNQINDSILTIAVQFVQSFLLEFKETNTLSALNVIKLQQFLCCPDLRDGYYAYLYINEKRSTKSNINDVLVGVETNGLGILLSNPKTLCEFLKFFNNPQAYKTLCYQINKWIISANTHWSTIAYDIQKCKNNTHEYQHFLSLFNTQNKYKKIGDIDIKQRKKSLLKSTISINVKSFFYRICDLFSTITGCIHCFQMGLIAVQPSRKLMLRKFLKYLERETDGIHVSSSSCFGLFGDESDISEAVIGVLRSKKAQNVPMKFILSHWSVLNQRTQIEMDDRASKRINSAHDLLNTVRILQNLSLENEIYFNFVPSFTFSINLVSQGVCMVGITTNTGESYNNMTFLIKNRKFGLYNHFVKKHFEDALSEQQSIVPYSSQAYQELLQYAADMDAISQQLHEKKIASSKDKAEKLLFIENF